MPHDPVGSRVWVNTGYGITPGTVVGDHINTPGVRQITLDGGGLVHAVQAVQQSEGLLELPQDIRLRLYREARQMRQKDENDKKEKLQSQKALYEKYERMRGMQETIVRMAASGYDGESPVLEHMRSSLSAYTAKYDAMRNEHEQKYGPFNPLNPYSAITSNSGGLVNAVQQSAGFTDLDDDTKEEVFKRYEAMRAQCESDLKSIQSWIGSFKFRQDISALKMSRALHPDDVETYNEQVQEMQEKIDEATSRLEAVQERLNGFAQWKGDLLKKAPPSHE